MPIYPGGVAWETIVKLPKEVPRLTAGMFDEQRRENDDDDNNCNSLKIKLKHFSKNNAKKGKKQHSHALTSAVNAL